MAKKAKSKFDPKVFLATVDGGLTKSNYRKGQTIFKQGDPSDAVFYIEKGKVKVTVISEQGKEAVRRMLDPGCCSPAKSQISPD